MQHGREDLDAYPETKVDVHHPQVVFNIEIRAKINVYSTIIPGPGGMPVGTNGKAMLLLSGGIDSPVAGYMMQNAVLRSMLLISMRRHILQSVQNKKSLTLQKLLQNIQDRSICTL